jgi:hypothetical protein
VLKLSICFNQFTLQKYIHKETNMKKILIIACVLTSTAIKAQIIVGDNTSSINTNSVLELESTNKGLRLPLVALTATDNPSPLSADVEGMVVFNTATSVTGNTAVKPVVYFNNGNDWLKVANEGTVSLPNTSLSNPTSPTCVSTGQIIYNTNASSGVLVGPAFWNGSSSVNNSSQLEPWLVAGGTCPATSNTQNIYQMGNVGIGSTAPSQRIDLVGNLQFSGALMPNGQSGSSFQLLTSSGSNAVTTWVSVPNMSFGNIKSSIQTVDHLGWILLKGRSLSIFNSTQQAWASALRIGTNLPNASDAYLFQNGSTLPLVIGSNSKAITKDQLPNFTLSETTNSTGGYKHGRGGNSSLGGGGWGLIQQSSGASNTAGSVNATSGEPKVIASLRELGFATDGAHTHTITTGSINGNVTQVNFDVRPGTF